MKEEKSFRVILCFVIIFFVPRLLNEKLLKLVICEGSTFQAVMKFEHDIFEMLHSVSDMANVVPCKIVVCPGFRTLIHRGHSTTSFMLSL